MELPAEIVAQFRRGAIARVETIEHAWTRVRASLAEDASLTVQRELHTLKGEANVIGFADVDAVCHALEDLIGAARARGYAVDGDVDLAVMMALRFVLRLVTGTRGADTHTFLEQLRGVLATLPTAGAAPPLSRPTMPARLSAEIRARLGPPAVDAFIEYKVAHGPRRDRLRASWHALRDLVGIRRAVASAAQLDKVAPGARALGAELGKRIDVRFELASVEVTNEILAALDTATLHLVRNAVDHGIATAGTITVRGALRGGAFVLEVEDDGAGIDVERVYARARELGLATDRLVDVLCQPGFSTRSSATSISGRGVGLDAVRAAAVDLGGTLALRTERGRGTTWTVELPVPALAVQGIAIRAPGLRFPVIIPPPWRLLDARVPGATILDLAGGLGLPPSTSIVTSIFYFTNDKDVLGLAAGGKPVAVDARRLVTTPPSALAEVATVDAIEGLLVRPERAAMG